MWNRDGDEMRDWNEGGEGNKDIQSMMDDLLFPFDLVKSISVFSFCVSVGYKELNEKNFTHLLNGNETVTKWGGGGDGKGWSSCRPHPHPSFHFGLSLLSLHQPSTVILDSAAVSVLFETAMYI